MTIQTYYDPERPFAEGIRYAVTEGLLNDDQLEKLADEASRMIVQVGNKFGSTASQESLRVALGRMIDVINIGLVAQNADYHYVARQLSVGNLKLLFRQGVTAINELFNQYASYELPNDTYAIRSWEAYFLQRLQSTLKKSEGRESSLTRYDNEKKGVEENELTGKICEWIAEHKDLPEINEIIGVEKQKTGIQNYLECLLIHKQPKTLYADSVKVDKALRNKKFPEAWKSLIQEMPIQFHSFMEDQMGTLTSLPSRKGLKDPLV